MRDHIHKVVGRYKGRIKAWDVVNEALNDDGSLRKTPWYRIIGEDYIAKAFQFAHEADPAAELRYNDYSIEKAPKRKGVIALVKKLQARSTCWRLGSQTHANLSSPTAELLDAALTDFAGLVSPFRSLNWTSMPPKADNSASARTCPRTPRQHGRPRDAANQKLA